MISSDDFKDDWTVGFMIKRCFREQDAGGGLHFKGGEDLGNVAIREKELHLSVDVYVIIRGFNAKDYFRSRRVLIDVRGVEAFAEHGWMVVRIWDEHG